MLDSMMANYQIAGEGQTGVAPTGARRATADVPSRPWHRAQRRSRNAVRPGRPWGDKPRGTRQASSRSDRGTCSGDRAQDRGG